MNEWCARTGLALLLLTCARDTVSAQVVDSVRGRDKLKAVEITGKAVSRPSDVTLESTGLPASVTTVSHEELERINVSRDVGSMLRRVPGIMSHTLGQGDIGNSIKMRGFATSTHGADVAVYIDGAPQNVPSSAVAHGMNDMSWLTPDMIERVEVIKGPVSALYGDQSRAGAINIITRTASASSLTASYASYGTRRGSVVASGSRGALSSLLVADVNDADGYRLNSGGARGTVFAKVSMVQGPSLWAFRGTFYESDWKAPGFLSLTALEGEQIDPIDRDTTSPPLWGRARRSSVVFTRTPAQGEGGTHGTAYLEHYERTRALGATLNDLNVQADDRRILGARVLQDVRVARDAQLAVGVEARADIGDAINRRWVAGVPGPNYTFDQDLDLKTYGVFAQGQYKPFRMLKVLGGLRYDAFDYDIRNRKLPAASLQYKKAVVTPHIGAVFALFEKLEVFTNRGESFRSPNQTEISPSGTLGPLGASGGAAIGSLKPPTVSSVDAGVNLYVSSRWRLSGTRYHTLNESEITLVSPGVYASVGNTLRDGYEADTRVGLTSGLDVYASYGRIMQARIKSAAPGTANRLPVPDNTVKAGLAYTRVLRVATLLLNLDGSNTSGLPYFSGAPLTTHFTRAYTRYDARASLEVQRFQVTAFATFQPAEFSTEVATSAASGALIDPRPPRELGLLVRYRFSSR